MAKKIIMFSAILVACVITIVVITIKKKEKLSESIIFANKLGIGINIGNSLDATGKKKWHEDATDLEYETYWDNPEITNELFVQIKKAGFSNVRIPVSWDEHMDKNNQISKIWMNRVNEVVDMALANDLYVILDLHHETWLSLVEDNEKEITEKFIDVWKQISEQFMDYDEHLIFEAMNEPRLQDSDIEWTSGTPELRQMVNRLNKAFYETVRQSGGNNYERYLMIPTYCNNANEESLKDLNIPEERVIVSVHGYKPYKFCLKDEDAKLWNDKESGTRNSDKKIEEFMSELNNIFVKKGVPVVITEFAAFNERTIEERLEWLECYLTNAKKYNIKCIWWDDGSNYALIDRTYLKWIWPEIVEKLVKMS